MEEKIKKFFSRKKSEAKFKLAGTGRKLNSEAPAPSKPKNPKDVYIPPKRSEFSEGAKAAAAAAMNRVQRKDQKEFNTSLATIQAQVRRELEAERKAKEQQQRATEVVAKPAEPDRDMAVAGVYFRCPMVSEEILPRKEWRTKIKEFLYEQLELEQGLRFTPCLIIYNCNVKDKAEQCVETLIKYLENIVNHPDEEKYRKIRMSNRIFSEKVKPVEGALEFLTAAGFGELNLDGEEFLVWSEENGGTIENLNILLDALQSAETINLELDRNIQVLLPSQIKRTTLPPDFYRVTPEEIKREQQMRSEALENAQVLKTKAMREKEELRTINKYKFSLIRIRFPNGVYLQVRELLKNGHLAMKLMLLFQGTFNVHDKMSEIFEFVQSCLMDEHAEFSLIDPCGHKFIGEDMERSLFDLR
jgi:UBX domain-containing protein 6